MILTWPQRGLLVVCIALAAGVLELAAMGVRVLAGRWALLGSDMVWMTPLGHLLLGLVILGVAEAVALTARPLRDPAIPVFLVALAGMTGVLVIFHPALHVGASLILAAGVATRLAMFVRRAPDRCVAVARRGVPLLAAAVVALGVAVRVTGRVSEGRRLAALPPASAAGPNILLLILDTARALSLSTYGYGPVTSPVLTSLARRGVLFQRAFAPAPWTLPSHASLFTGRPAHELNADWWTPLDTTFPTLAEVLRDRGYLTVGVVGNTINAGAETGLGRGFAHYDDHDVTPATVLESMGLVRFVAANQPLRRLLGTEALLARRTGDVVTQNLTAWLDRHPGRPWFAFVNLFDPHHPYTPPVAWLDRFAEGRAQPPFLERVWNDGRPLANDPFAGVDSSAARAAYDAALGWTDSMVGGLLDALAARGDPGNTLVVVTADHGEEFLEHGRWEHGSTLYQTALRVPLVIAWPARIPAGRVVEPPVAVSNVAATILDLLDADAALPGRSLAALWNDSLATGDTIVSSRAPSPHAAPARHARGISIVAGDYHYIRRLRGTTQLFNYVADPWEQQDLAHDAAYRDTVATFTRVLERVETRP